MSMNGHENGSLNSRASAAPAPMQSRWTALSALLGFACLGIAIALASMRIPIPATERMSITEPIAIEAASRFGAHGFFVKLPQPSPEGSRLVENGWVLDPPDNGDAPRQCGHRIRVNGTSLADAHRPHQAIGDADHGAYSIWGTSINAGGVYFSLPEGADALTSLEIEWQLTRVTQRMPAQPATYTVVAIIGWAVGGVVLLAASVRPRRLGWAGATLVACAGMGLAVPALAVLCGPMDQQAMEAMQRAAIASAVWGSAACMALALLIAAAGGRWNCLGRDFPVTAVIAALAVGIVANHLVIGRTCFVRESSAFDGSGIGSSLIASRLPFSDALAWFVGAEAVRNGAEISWTARRPLHTCIRAGQLVLGGGHLGSLLLQAGLLAAAATALACTVWRALSPAAAIAVLIGVLQASHGFERSFLTECTGLSISCLAAALLIRGWGSASKSLRLGGTAALGAAWLVRPGPLGLLLLPTVSEWLTAQERRWRRGLVALAVVGVMLAAGKGLFKVLAAPDAVENANAAPTVYGLATGMDWSEAYMDFAKRCPESKAMSLADRTALMYQEAWRRFREDPRPCGTKLVSDLRNGFKTSVVELPWRLWVQPVWPGVSASSAVSRVFGYGLLGIAAIAALTGRFRVRPVARGLGLAVAASIASLPFIWGDGGMRGTMMALPFVVCFVAVPLAMPQTIAGDRARIAEKHCRVPQIFTVALLAAFGLTGIVAFAFGRSTTHQRLPIQVDLDRDPSVVLTDAWRDHGVWGAAAVPVTLAVSNLRITSNKAYGLDAFVGTLRPGTALVLAARVESASQWIVVEGLGDRRAGRLEIEETESTSNQYFLRACKWHWLD